MADSQTIYISYSQNTSIPGAVTEVQEMIQRKIEPPVSLLETKKSAIVLVSIKLNKAGKYISSTMQYNEKSDVYANVRAVIKGESWYMEEVQRDGEHPHPDLLHL